MYNVVRITFSFIAGFALAMFVSSWIVCHRPACRIRTSGKVRTHAQYLFPTIWSVHEGVAYSLCCCSPIKSKKRVDADKSRDVCPTSEHINMIHCSITISCPDSDRFLCLAVLCLCAFELVLWMFPKQSCAYDTDIRLVYPISDVAGFCLSGYCRQSDAIPVNGWIQTIYLPQ